MLRRKRRAGQAEVRLLEQLHGHGSADCCASSMTTRLDGTLKREILVDGEPYTVTLSEIGIKLTRKGRRKGLVLNWKDLLSGEQALAVALNASLERYPEPVARKGTKTSNAPQRKRHLRVVKT